MTSFQCNCKARKEHRLVLDGGPAGEYHLELCSSCYSKEDKKFVVREEQILVSKIIGPEGPCSPNPSSVSLLEEVTNVG